MPESESPPESPTEGFKRLKVISHYAKNVSEFSKYSQSFFNRYTGCRNLASAGVTATATRAVVTWHQLEFR